MNKRVLKCLCLWLLLLNLILPFASCKKLVQIEPPVNTVITEIAFSDDNAAIASVSGIYRNLAIYNRNNICISNGALTVYSGMSADELKPFGSTSGDLNFYNNMLLDNFGNLSTVFWNPGYFIIYQANSCIEGLTSSSGISSEIKARLLGEVKFIRALNYFYLTNLFGDIPYVNTTDWEESRKISNTPKAELYKIIIEDLEGAIELLPVTYAASNNERIIANKWAAVALLARVKLYQGNWAEAERNASLLLDNNNLFSLNIELNNVFLKNNPEVILQWQLNSAVTTFNATAEGYNIIPQTNRNPTYYLTDWLLSAFENGDKRKQSWVRSVTYQGTVYNHPYKYKIGRSQAVINAIPTEYQMVLRLAEQYLIRAEARAHLNKLIGANSAASDLNAIRNRAGLGNTTATTQTEMLAAVAQERQIELFAEWGHRWLDLKRTGKIDEVMSAIKPAWKPHQQYYPIPFSELQLNPNLKPTPGY